MRLNVALKAGLCVFLLAGLASVHAEEDTDDVEVFDVDEIVDEDDDYEVGPSQDIETAFMFADYPNKSNLPSNIRRNYVESRKTGMSLQFYQMLSNTCFADELCCARTFSCSQLAIQLELGEIIKVLFLFNNKGDIGFNVTHIFASLRSPYDYNYHIQNFSAMPIGTLVPPGAQASFEYLFKPDPSLEPTEFWLTTEVVYNSSEDRTYKSAVFNGTVELVEKNAEVDVRKFITYLVIIAGMGYGGYSMFKGKKTKKSGDKKKAGAAKAVEIEEEKVELRKQSRGQDGNVINRAVRRKKSSKKKGRKN